MSVAFDVHGAVFDLKACLSNRKVGRNTEDSLAHDPQHRRRIPCNVEVSFVADPDDVLQGAVVQDVRIQLVAGRMGDGKDNRRLPVDQDFSLVEEAGGRVRPEKGLERTAEFPHAADFPNVSLGRLPIHGESQIGFGAADKLNLGDDVMAFFKAVSA